jgi:hypothetical protein
MKVLSNHINGLLKMEQKKVLNIPLMSNNIEKDDRNNIFNVRMIVSINLW